MALTGKHIAILLLTAILPLAGCRKKKDAEAAVPEVEVSLPTVDSVTLHKVLPGVIEASSRVDVVARVNGRLLSVNYKPGDYVRKGQTLFTIESTTYRDAVTRARSAIAEAQSNRDYYSRQYEAMKKALASDAVSRMDVNQAENNLRNAEAALQSARAQLETASTQLSYCTVTAPVAGHISHAEIDPGNVLTGEGNPVKLATIYNDDSVEAVFDISDVQYETLLSSASTTSEPLFSAMPLSFDTPKKHSYTADLYYTSPSVDENTGTFTLRGRIKNAAGELKEGMFVSVALPYAVEPHAVLVRDASIGTDQLGKYLYVVNDSDKVVYTPVTVGELYHDTLRIISKGITPRSRYVTKALLNVRNGEKIKPVTAR